MKLQHFKAHEDEENFHVVHPSGEKFTMKKSELSTQAHAMIKKMCSGGSVQKFASKGEVQPDADAEMQSAPLLDPGVEAGVKELGSKAWDWVNRNNPDYKSDTTQAPASVPAPQPAPAPAPPMATGQPPVTQPPDGAMSAPVTNMNMNKALEEERAAYQQQAKVAGQQGAAESKAFQEAQDQVDQLPTQQELVNDNKEKSDALLKAYTDQKIDPNQYFKKMDTTSKIAAGIGLFLGGLSTPFTHQANPAIGILQNAIDRDVDAQKNEQGKAHNLWTMNREALGTDMAANLATQTQLYTGLKYKLMQAASQFKGPNAQANAQLAIAGVDQKIAANNYRLSFLQPNKEGAQDPDYPEKVVANSGLFGPEPKDQKEALDEIAYRKNLKSIAQPSMEAFDAIGLHRPADLNPMQDTPEQQHWQGLANTTVKEQEGTARQAAFDSIKKNFMPNLGDSDARRQQKREGWAQYLEAKKTSQFMNSRGLDLDKFPSTSLNIPPAMNNMVKQKVNIFMQKNPTVKDPVQAMKILKDNGKL
jgi:hypothetical protein